MPNVILSAPEAEANRSRPFTPNLPTLRPFTPLSLACDWPLPADTPHPPAPRQIRQANLSAERALRARLHRARDARRRRVRRPRLSRAELPPPATVNAQLSLLRRYSGPCVALLPRGNMQSKGPAFSIRLQPIRLWSARDHRFFGHQSPAAVAADDIRAYRPT